MSGEADRPRLLADEAATLGYGAQLARALPDDAAPLVLYLHGELGAGKTTLARGVIQALGEAGPVRSPTYALVTQYRPGGHSVVHLDLYRLNSAEELLALGLPDYLPDSRLWLVEWPEKAQGAGLPAADAQVHLEPLKTGRQARFTALSAAGRAWLAALTPEAG